jgi:CRISPR/Cas system CSM-associated protein Csm2 small subunit
MPENLDYKVQREQINHISGLRETLEDVIPRRDSESWQLNREIVVESE